MLVLHQSYLDGVLGHLLNISSISIDNGIFHGIDTYDHRKTRSTTDFSRLINNLVEIRRLVGRNLFRQGLRAIQPGRNEFRPTSYFPT